MANLNNEGYLIRANRATARACALCTAGKSGSIATDGTDKTAALEGDAVYMLYATTDTWIGQADATGATNRTYLPAGVQFAIQTPAAGQTLHASQVAAGGTLYYSKHDDQV